MADPKQTTDDTARSTANALASLANSFIPPPKPKGSGEKRTIVRMKKLFGNNYPGEVCGYPEAVAEELIAQKAAERYTPQK
jgi:hypothetical protein